MKPFNWFNQSHSPHEPLNSWTLFPCGYIAHALSSTIKSSHNNPFAPSDSFSRRPDNCRGTTDRLEGSTPFHTLCTITLPLIQLQKVQLIKRLTQRTWELSGNRKTPWWPTVQPLTFSGGICLCPKKKLLFFEAAVHTSCCFFCDDF